MNSVAATIVVEANTSWGQDWLEKALTVRDIAIDSGHKPAVMYQSSFGLSWSLYVPYCCFKGYVAIIPGNCVPAVCNDRGSIYAVGVKALISIEQLVHEVVRMTEQWKSIILLKVDIANGHTWEWNTIKCDNINGRSCWLVYEYLYAATDESYATDDGSNEDQSPE